MGDGSIKSSMYFLCTKHFGRVHRISNDGIRSISDVRFFLSLALELILRPSRGRSECILGALSSDGIICKISSGFRHE